MLFQKYGKRLLVLLLTLCVLRALGGGAIADFGDFSGDSDYGGSDSSWSSSDYDSGGSGGSGDGQFDPVTTVILLVAVGYFLIRSRGKKNAAGGGDAAGAGTGRKLTSMNAYYEIDPAFNEAAFREKLSNLYVQMQNCWTAKDISSLRPYFDDAYFMQMERQLDQHRKKGRTNYVDRIAVLSVTLEGFYQSGGRDHIVVTMKTRIVDYTLDDSTGKLVSGHQDREKFMTYEFELARTAGFKTPEKDGLDRIVCPSCGAPLDINASARCPYCGSVIQNTDHDWVITAIRGISQETR